MSRMIVIGAGPNALVAACWLARAGVKVLVLERRADPGGSLVTGEIARGFRGPVLSHVAGPLLPEIASALDLAAHGLRPIQPPTDLTVLHPEGRALVLPRRSGAPSIAVTGCSPDDTARLADLLAALDGVGRVAGPLLRSTPPSLTSPGTAEALALVTAGRRLRALGRRDVFRLLRWATMPVADFATEWFESDLLQAAVAARGIFGRLAGPRSAGTAIAPLLEHALTGSPFGSSATAHGGPGATGTALAAAARAAGAEIRTQADVVRVRAADGRVTGVVLAGGEEIAADAVLSGVDPKRTLLGLVDPGVLEPEFRWRIENYRAAGTLAKINLALDGLPEFPALAALGETGRAALEGRIQIGFELDYLERAFDAAKYGRCSEWPYLELTIPSLADPSLAPPGRHVMSIYFQFAPYRLREGEWSARRDVLVDTTVRTLALYAPRVADRIVAVQAISPWDLETNWGLSGGHIFHGEQSLEQSFAMRPVLGWAQYRTPLSGLYLCGAGTHPGGGLTGASGWNAARQMLKDLPSSGR